MGFKVAAILCFFFLNAIIGNEIITFIVVVLLAAFDFWTVKNVTGRLLVNLRWQSEIDEFGNEKMVYESDDSRQTLKAAAAAGDPDAKEQLQKLENQPGVRTDAWIFWTALYVTPVIWFFLIFGQLLSFRFFWFITASICLSLSFANAQGYYYCQQDHKAKLSEYIQQRGLTVFMNVAKDQGWFQQIGARAYSALLRRGNN